MLCCLKEVAPRDMPAVFAMMQEQHFPHVPDSYEGALEVLSEAELWGVYQENELQAVILFGDMTSTSAFVDVVCRKEAQGKWATPRVMRQLYDYAFRSCQLDFLWCQPHNTVALTAALKAGFVLANSGETPPVLILTRQRLRQRFKKYLEN
jgi:hypothetical protein